MRIRNIDHVKNAQIIRKCSIDKCSQSFSFRDTGSEKTWVFVLPFKFVGNTHFVTPCTT